MSPPEGTSLLLGAARRGLNRQASHDPSPRRRHRSRPDQPRGQHGGRGLGQPARRPLGHRRDHPVRRLGLCLPDRRRGEGLPAGGVHLRQGSAAHGHLHSLRAGRRHPGRERCRAGHRRRAERGAGRAHRLHRRIGHRRPAADRGDARRADGARAAARLAVLRAGVDRQHDLRASVDPVRLPGAEPGDRHRLHDRSALDRRGRAG